MYLDAARLAQALPWQPLVDALRSTFATPVTSPVRHHHEINVPGEPKAMLLLMPAWIEGRYLGVKQVAVFPGNNARSEPGLSSHYLLSCAKTGVPLAQLDGNELTARRTAAASALASAYLSRDNASRLLMIGAGRMARYLVDAHRAVRPLEQVRVYNRTPAAAQRLVQELRDAGIAAEVVSAQGLAEAAGWADIVSCATLANTPVLQGDWLSPGVHVDLVGAFTPRMREADDAAVTRCTLFVDTRNGALSEGGDLVQPIARGVIGADSVVADLHDLSLGRHRGRAQLPDPERALTLFKSVGASLEDLAAAVLAYERCRGDAATPAP